MNAKKLKLDKSMVVFYLEMSSYARSRFVDKEGLSNANFDANANGKVRVTCQSGNPTFFSMNFVMKAS